IGQNVSTQDQMEYYISKKIQECVNFSVFEELGTNIEVLNEPQSTVIFGREGFNVNVSYPFLVSVQGGQPITIRRDFQIRSPVRLKEMYILAQTIIKRDAKNIFYNKTEEFYSTRAQVFSYLENMTFRFVEKPCSTLCTFGKYDDVFQIIDNESLVRNKPYVYQFAIKNRRPALDYIHETRSSWFDIIGSEGVPLILDPRGYDPDEDRIIYSYKAWREDYWDRFKPDCCDAGPGTVDCSNLTELWDNRDICFDREEDNPKSWSTSVEFQDTERRAGYMPEFNDTGIHHTIIWIEDDFGLEDWQNITILIYDLPHANATGKNNFSDIDNNRSSIEDPYTLDSSGSTVYLSRMLLYNWTDLLDGFHNITRKENLYMPFEVYPAATIESNPNQFFFKFTGMHNISLTAASDLETITWGPPDYLIVNVTECVPHRNYSASYPYNDPNINPYLANHTCCREDYTYYDIDKACFTDLLYGGYFDFDRSNFMNTPMPPNSIPLDYEPGLAPNYPFDNDIYKSNYTRYCSNTRGNVCSGAAEEIQAVIEECNDKLSGEEERCQGPPQEGPFFDQVQCVNYTTGMTFELNYSRPGAIGICQHDPECSDLNEFKEPAKFKCQGLCNDGTCSQPKIEGCYCTDECGETISNECDTQQAGQCVGTTGFCNDFCDFDDPDESIRGCNCTYTPGKEECQVNERYCWVENATGPGFCCQPGDNGCDGEVGSAIGACVNGYYLDNEEQIEFICTCEAGEGAWFGFNQCCDDGNSNEDYQDPGAGNYCCYNGDLMAEGDHTQYLLCYGGRFYDCGDMINNAGTDIYVAFNAPPIGGFTCTSTGWHP
ncbi:MAG: hypothetical protein ABIE94_04970, partial [archaeon]